MTHVHPPRFVRSPDGSLIAYEIFAGVEPAVVILHGLAGSRREFESTARALAGRKVIIVDQRGHGDSTRRPPSMSREAFVADAVAVIEAASTRPVYLVGQSMGAHTAMLVAATHPHLVDRLIMLEVSQGGDAPEHADEIGQYFSSWSIPYANESAALAELGGSPLAPAWVADMETTAEGLRPRFDADVMVRAAADLREERWVEWERVVSPSLVVYADGGMFDEAQKARFLDRNRLAIRADLQGASHDAHLDAFEQWIHVLVSFIGGEHAGHRRTESHRQL